MKFETYEITTMVRANSKRLILRCRDGKFYLTLPPQIPKKIVEAFLQSQASWMQEQQAAFVPQPRPVDPASLKATVAQLLPIWEKRMGVKVTAVRYQEMISRWGSCRPKTGRITLNLQLARYPEACIEYVLVHELCHLLHPNHSPAFYAAMTHWLPDWQERRQILNGKRTDDIL